TTVSTTSPKCFSAAVAIDRPTESVPPPAEYGIISSNGFVGKSISFVASPSEPPELDSELEHPATTTKIMILIIDRNFFISFLPFYFFMFTCYFYHLTSVSKNNVLLLY